MTPRTPRENGFVALGPGRYRIIQATSRAEAIEWTTRFPNPAGYGKEIEIPVTKPGKHLL
jgi:hypothetical protein